MGRPTGVGNPDLAISRRYSQGLFKLADLPLSSHTNQSAGCVDDRYA
jgi:hypothetical protein